MEETNIKGYVVCFRDGKLMVEVSLLAYSEQEAIAYLSGWAKDIVQITESVKPGLLLVKSYEIVA